MNSKKKIYLFKLYFNDFLNNFSKSNFQFKHPNEYKKKKKMRSSENKTYNDSSQPSVYNLSWMQSIPDSTKLSSMTIPGTHNSCALQGICCARTQSWSLPEQMKAGLRYFDIRLRLYNNTLRSFHAFVDQKDTFDIILSYALNFLNQYPSECIIMQVIKEYKEKNCTKKIAELYEEYTNNIKDKIIEFKKKDITMGEIRGKILIIKIFGRSTLYQPGFLIQNKWNINTRFSMNTKKRKIKENIHRSLASRHDKNSKIFLNYLSSSSNYALMTPYTAAKKCNKIPLRYKGKLGIVLADYPGEDLIKHLIEQNFINDDNTNANKNMIKDGDTVYIVHNDTQKYLFLDGIDIKNKIYCIKEPFGLSIEHKNKDINRDYFMEKDDIYLIGRNNYRYELKISDIKDDIFNDKIIYDNSLFRLQILENNEIKNLECKYENKNSKSQYLLKTTNEPDIYESLFSIIKVFK